MSVQERIEAIRERVATSSHTSVSAMREPERIYHYQDVCVTEDIPWLLAYIEKLQPLASWFRDASIDPLDPISEAVRELQAFEQGVGP